MYKRQAITIEDSQVFILRSDVSPLDGTSWTPVSEVSVSGSSVDIILETHAEVAQNLSENDIQEWELQNWTHDSIPSVTTLTEIVSLATRNLGTNFDNQAPMTYIDSKIYDATGTSTLHSGWVRAQDIVSFPNGIWRDE